MSTRPEFTSQWRPDDESGTALIKALAELYRNVSAENVRTFANALDTHLGADAARHQVEEYGGGFVTWLSGVADYQRIPQLALPRKLRLYVCPDGREPEVPEKDRPAAWLVLRMQAATQRKLSPPGVAVLDARTVLQLAAPDRRGVATPRSHRTVNLLRAMGRGLRVVDVVGRQPLPDDRSGPAAHPHEEHEDLAWWLDLLGVRYTDAVVDMLLYDTDGHPVALRAALAGLLPDTDRPFELTSEALQEWRADPEAQAAFHDSVVDRSFLGSDREAAAALRAVLLLIRDDPELTLSAEGIASVLGSSAPGAGSPPMELKAALSRVAAAGFLRQEPGDRSYRWNGPGLAALLIGPDPRRVESRLDQDLRELYDRRDRSEESAVLGLLEVRESYTHTAVNRTTGATDAIRRMLEREDLSEQARVEAQGALRALEEGQQAEARARDPQWLYGDLHTKEPLDLRAELQSHCLGLLTEAPANVVVDFLPDTDQEVVVWASHQLLKMAVANLLDNALREIGPEGRIRVTLSLLPRGREGVGGPVARVDIEDSGPGVPENWLPFLNGTVSGPPPVTPKGSGRGVTFARNFIVAHNGTLVFLARSRDLRGAHVRIELPVTETPPQR
ncbi:ATP-binding protein [Streptomyces sp. NBC_00988]|uniref:ATP-binding protein n=1 Tax=Streptomyces sp. NBC_00988 TaxID=2903704 RepID=UPI00386F10FD|nr:ATP-binding protein [Streptomyces sp. NBC_00988]